VHLLDLVVKLSPLEDLQSVAVYVKDLIRLDLGMAALDDGFLDCVDLTLACFLLIQSLYFPFPLFLNNLDHIALVLRLENGQLNFDRAFFYENLSFGLRITNARLQSLHVIGDDLGRKPGATCIGQAQSPANTSGLDERPLLINLTSDRIRAS